MSKIFSTFLLLFLFTQVSHAQTADQIRKGAMKITAVARSHVMVSGGQKLVPGQNILIVRLIPDDDDYETIANGKAIRLKSGAMAVEIEMEKLKKAPLKTDVAVLLGAPKIFVENNAKGEEKNPMPQEGQIETPEPGYVWFQYLMDNAKLTTTSSNIANEAKQVGHLPRHGIAIEWFLDFVSHYGFSYSSTSTTVPINSYYRQDVSATVTQNIFKLMYRTDRYSGFRGLFIFQAAVDDFKTNNPDEQVISTVLNVNSIGGAVDWQPGELLLHSESTRFQLTYLRFMYVTAFSGTAQDGEFVKRGGSAKVTANEMRAIISTTGYFPWIPWAKRFTFNLDYYQKDTTLAFSGDVKHEFTSFPANGTYGEKDSGILFSIGLRFDDVVGRVFRPKD